MAKLVKYEDYCPRCPYIAEDDEMHSRPRPDKCHHCTPESFTDYLRCWVEADVDIQKLNKKIDDGRKGIDFYAKKKHEFYQEIIKHVKVGQTRAIDLCGLVVVLHCRQDRLDILYAEKERNPDG